MSGASAAFPPVTSSAVPVHDPIRETPPPKPETAGVAPRQATLFGAPKIISMALPLTAPQRRQETVRRAASPATRPATTRSNQPGLDFQPAAPPRRTVLSGDAAIASPALRLKAAALDALVFAAAVAIAAAAFHFMGGRLSFNRQVLYGCGGAIGAMLLFYHLFWSVLGCDTAGMRHCRISVLTFDGSAPEPRLRMVRMAVACLSILALGLGLFWALVDEEGLTWQDHVSQTFPAVPGPQPGTVPVK